MVAVVVIGAVETVEISKKPYAVRTLPDFFPTEDSSGCCGFHKQMFSTKLSTSFPH